jgi:hypothetical protein
MRQDADARAAEVERRLANLEAEIAALRAESGKEEEAETGRFGRTHGGGNRQDPGDRPNRKSRRR